MGFSVSYRSKFLNVAVLLTAVFVFAGSLTAQEDYDPDLQSWNDLELTVPVNKKLDLNLTGTVRIDHDISRSSSWRFNVGFNVKPNRTFSFGAFETFIANRSSSGRFRYEYRSGARAVYRFPVKAVDLSHRSQFEYRVRPGRNTWRYRPSVTIRKSLPESFLKDASVYITEEPFYDSASGRFSRNRLSFGLRKAINKKFSVELYYLYQGDNFSSPRSVNVIGTNWRVSL